MPSKVTKRGRMRWMARIQKDGLIRQKIFETKAEALKWETGLRDADWSKTDTEFSVGEWAQRYLDYSGKFSRKAYGEKVKAFKELFAAKDRKGRLLVNPESGVRTLTPGVVLDVLQVQFRKRSGYAANKDRKNLVAAWNWGIKYLGLPAPNPCLVERFPEVRQPRYVPPEEDFWKVFGLTTGQDRLMLLAFLHLGARRGEIFNLTWADVDFAQQRIRLSTCKRRDGTLEHDWLPMTNELKVELLWWWEHRTFRQHTHVFVCEDRTAFTQQYYGVQFRNRQHFIGKLCEKAGVKPFGFHAVRHLTASILFRLGQPVAIIQSILRHKSASTTERYLKSLGLEETRSALEELSGRGPAKVIQIKSRPMLEHRTAI